jgi:hypothetical protein
MLVPLIASMLVIATIGMAAGGAAPKREKSPERSESAITFRNDMRKLWEDHITWTRLVIVSFAHDLPDREPTVSRLLQNQDDIGNAIKPFYGEAAGTQLTTLLREHITTAAEILVAAKAGDAVALDDAIARWYANADEIAQFLSAANPENWPLEETREMMREHLDLTLAEAVARLEGRFADDIATYEQIHQQILHMADFLSLGIIDQFPRQFGSSPDDDDDHQERGNSHRHGDHAGDDDDDD